MKTKRIKNPIADPASIDINACVGEIAALMNAERALCADKDAELQQLEARYANPNPSGRHASDPYTTLGLVEIKKRIGTETVRAQLWAEANPDQFARRKSLELTHGKIGFRTGTPKLKTIARWTWAKVLTAIRGFVWAQPYIRVIEEVDKEKIIADKPSADQLASIGVKIVQEESFFVEPNLTDLNPRTSRQSPAKADAVAPMSCRSQTKADAQAQAA